MARGITTADRTAHTQATIRRENARDARAAQYGTTRAF